MVIANGQRGEGQGSRSSIVLLLPLQVSAPKGGAVILRSGRVQRTWSKNPIESAKSHAQFQPMASSVTDYVLERAAKRECMSVSQSLQRQTPDATFVSSQCFFSIRHS